MCRGGRVNVVSQARPKWVGLARLGLEEFSQKVHIKSLTFRSLLLSTVASQGEVTYTSPFEAFATGIKIFDQPEVCLIA